MVLLQLRVERGNGLRSCSVSPRLALVCFHSVVCIVVLVYVGCESLCMQTFVSVCKVA